MSRLFKSIFLVSFLLFLCSVYVFAEDITVTTYYPSPYGSYNQLATNRLAVGDTNTSGRLDAADQPPEDGQIYTARSVIFKPQSSDPNANKVTGELIYNSSENKFKYYDGSGWVAAGGSGGCYVSYSGSCLGGFTNKGSAGFWDYCCGTSDNNSCLFTPAGSGCFSGWRSISSGVGIGEASICCQ